ncbi:HIG1 domain member 2A [Stygiomarasmius scandens]|uniref:HIG1 domain member 2A n=1 Tax=Marasmiellus scandens TaxID=2682957 RepID=A0ABR1JRX6_9AGAR
MSSTEAEPQTSSSQAPAQVDNSRRWTETYQEKLVRKVNENPWVPIGALLTTGALVMASIRLRQGNSQKLQHWLRARVALQTVTVLAVLGGLYKYGQANLEENQRIMEMQRQVELEKKAIREREEFEERIRQAGEAQKEEEALRKGRLAVNNATAPTPASTQNSSGWSSWFTFGRSQNATLPTPVSAVSELPSPSSPSADSSGSNSSWWKYLGWNRSSSRPNSDNDASK